MVNIEVWSSSVAVVQDRIAGNCDVLSFSLRGLERMVRRVQGEILLHVL